MKRLSVVILLLGVLSLACSTQVATAFPTTPTPAATATASPTPRPSPTTAWTSVVRMEYVNVRQEPNGTTVDYVRRGIVVEIISCDNSWCLISDPAGYVWRGCLSDNPEKLGCRSK